MANHKRGKAKNQRAGCLMCKPHKVNGAKQGRLGRVGLEKHSDQLRSIEENYEPQPEDSWYHDGEEDEQEE